MLSIPAFLKHLTIFALTLLAVSFPTALLSYALLHFVSSLYPQEAYRKGLSHIAYLEQWQLNTYVMAISYSIAKVLALVFRLGIVKKVKIILYLLMMFLVFLGFGGIYFGSLFTYAFLIPLLTSVFLIAVVEEKITKWLFKTKNKEDANS